MFSHLQFVFRVAKVMLAGLIAAGWLHSVWPVQAVLVTNQWVPIFQGIEYNTGFTDAAEPILQKVYALRVNLRDPDVELFSTPSNGVGAEETDRQTTTQFIAQYGVQVAVNANFFSLDTGSQADLLGLAVSRGEVVSPPVASGTGVAAFMATRSNVCSFPETSGGWIMPTNTWTAVAGSATLLRNGTVVNHNDPAAHPRTALGLSRSNEFLIMMVIDGRQPGYSDGSILTNTALWLQRFGAWNGINLDGGGSTTMAKQEGAGTLILNRPSGGIQRMNGNALGIFAPPIPPGFVQAPQSEIVLVGSNATFSVLASGTTPLRYQWQRNGTNISGATTNTLNILNLQPGGDALYALVVTNAYGAITSAPAALQVHYSLTMLPEIGGLIVPSPNQTSFPPGYVVPLTAQADPGFVFTGWGGDVAGTNPVNSITMDSAKTVTAGFFGSVPEIILDNTNAAFTGTWKTGTTASGKFGADYNFSEWTNALSTATYRPTIHTPGQYAIYLWYSIGGNRATNAPWLIAHEDGNALVPVNQQMNGGEWIPISAGKKFARGTNGFVQLSNQSGPIVVMADGVKLVYGTPPVIVQPPSPAVTLAGTEVSFTIQASGTPALHYQWTFHGTNLPGATAASLVKTNVQPGDAGHYAVVITNLYGATTSVEAALTVLVPPAISASPESQSVPQATNVTFTVTAMGTTPLFYQWRKNDFDLSGATSSSWTLTNVQTSDAGAYSVWVTNVAGAVLSANATLTVSSVPAAPFLTQPPQNKTVVAGENAVLTVSANGTEPLQYQWYYENQRLAGAVGSSLTLTNSQPVHAGNYAVVVSNAVGGVTSNPVRLNVHYSLAVIPEVGGAVVRNPAFANYEPGFTVTLTAVSDPGFVFTGWGGAVAGTNNPLTITLHSNQTIAAAFFGSVADIIIDNTNAAATFTTNWQTGTSAGGRWGVDYRFASSAAGGGWETATYRPFIHTAGRYNVHVYFPSGSNRTTNAVWTTVFDGGVETTAINQTTGGGTWRLIAAAQPLAFGTNGFARLSNETGEIGKVVMADAVRFVHLPPPEVVTPPTNQTVFVSDSVVIQAVVSGAEPLSYQWLRSGTNLAGATASTLLMADVPSSAAGNYAVTVSNVAGMVTSAAMTLTVLPLPAPVHFDAITLLPNGTLHFSAVGTAQIVYAIEVSTNLTSWLPLTNLTSANGFLEFTDENAANDQQRFYRARWGP